MMQFIPAAGGLLGLAASKLFSPKAPPQVQAPAPTATRDDARGMIAAQDALRKRRGGAADIVTGAGGAEAGAGSTGKATLGS